MLKKYAILVLSITLAPVTYGDTFIACSGKYALCTTAPCKPVEGKKDTVACECEVKEGYSAATQECQPVPESAKVQQVFSRYYPVKSYIKCSNDRAWAWCLDKPCLIDKNNPDKASCECTLVKNLGDYVIVVDPPSNNNCTTGIISSATVQQVNEISDFLKTQKDLQPYPIKVIESNDK